MALRGGGKPLLLLTVQQALAWEQHSGCAVEPAASRVEPSLLH